ncbi:hypothetical protein FACS1894164_15450 [Spirochaetia bacterium]|nr:hypothetical protein FACS1894164_15450 [Spirochaetia bacterium]
MFESVFYQSAVQQLAADIAGASLAPSLLFSGPAFSGKGTAALELARICSCGNPESLACECSSCKHHRILSHPDLLMLGPRDFSAEIAASAAAFARDRSLKTLLVRAIRKLLGRFAPVLLEDDPKFSKIGGLIVSLEENLGELYTLPEDTTPEQVQKQIDSLTKDAFKLESEGMSDSIPIAHIRRAGVWAHLSPTSNAKVLLIENADRMQEGSRNALLKLLEEPPEYLSIVLTTPREKALLPTILSRVRPYRFTKRDRESEIIQKVFHEKSDLDIGTYLGSFLPVKESSLRPLAALFAASVARAGIRECQRRRKENPDHLIALGKYATPCAEKAGLGKGDEHVNITIEKILDATDKFSLRGSFSRFLASLLAVVAESRGLSPASGDVWRKSVTEANQGVEIYNQTPALAMERLSFDLGRNLV